MPIDRNVASYLAAVKASQRMLLFAQEGPLLRKPRNPAAATRQKPLLREFRAMVRDEMKGRGRRAFRGPVSVDLSLFGGLVSAPATVKAYLDAMEGLVYADDRSVTHLQVSRWRADETEGHAFVTVEPASTYAACFDRVFARGNDFDEDESCFWREDKAPWSSTFSDYDEEELSRLLREEARDPGDPEPDDEDEDWLDWEELEVRRTMRRYRQESIAALRRKLMLDQFLTFRDRPGAPPDWMPLALEADPSLDLVEDFDHVEMPGVMWLPLPGASGYRDVLKREMRKRFLKWDLWRNELTAPVALDIAVQGLRAPGKDLDNLAWDLIVAFEENFCAEPGLAEAYRIYHREGARLGVRLKLLERSRLEALDSLISEAHSAVPRLHT